MDVKGAAGDVFVGRSEHLAALRAALEVLPWSQVFAGLNLPDVFAQPQPARDPDAARFELFSAAVAALRAAAHEHDKPILLALDDLHDADHASLLLARFVARQAKDMPLLVVATWRDTAADGPTAELVADAARAGRSVHVRGLDVDAVAELTRAVAPDAGADARALHSASGGSPLFLRAILDAGADTVPATAREAIRRRAAALSPAALDAMPQMNGRFPQVSGLQFGYPTLRPPGLRVEWVRRPDGTPVDLGPTARYTVAMNGFMAGGGDGYGPFNGREQTRDPLDTVVADYLTANSPVSPPGPVSPAVAPETRIFRLS